MNEGGPAAFVSDSSWEVAKKFVQGMGNFSNSLTQVTRVLEREKFESEVVDPTCFFMMRTLLAHHRIRSNIYFAVLTLYPEDFNYQSSLTAKQLIKQLDRSTHSALASAIFAYNRAKSVANEEHIPELDKDIQEYGEVGMIVGRHLPNLGIAKGLILALVRHLAFAAFSQKKPADYTKYRSATRRQKKAYDLQLESQHFGCHHSQLASLIVQKLGFRRKFAQACYLALASNIKTIPEDAAVLREACRLVDFIMLEEDIPSDTQLDYSRLGTSRAVILEPLKTALKVRTSGSLSAWMSKTEEQVNAQNSPDLYEEAPGHIYDEEFDFSSVPESVRSEFSMEDFASFRSAIHDILGD
jgi:hypothetical protein